MWYKKRAAKKLTSKQVGLRYGFRSGLEEAIASDLDTKSVNYKFEENKLTYVKPQKTHTYTPDFYLVDKNIYIETKGYFTSQDRQKMRLIREQHPELDIRFVFSNSKTKISKKSKTTYGMWCEKYGFKYADKIIPREWLDE
ncbi:endodeoxyribonuclease I [Pelagibacter phage HTVC168P]|nr:endodeoxyribonuclease I [Pelagibacter phage HTVC168P]